MKNNNILKLFRPYEVSGLTRLGHEFDGGYIVHSPSLNDADYLINYGVGYNVVFEKDFYKTTNKPTLAFDPTLKDLKPIFEKLFKGQVIYFLRHLKNYLGWKKTEATLPEYKIDFIEEGISDVDTPKYKTFKYHFDKYGLADKSIIFKLDVEGYEYAVFKDETIYPLLNNAVQIYIEFHSLKERLHEAANIIAKLQETHSLVHIHANNHSDFFNYEGEMVPDTIEVTFLLNKYLPVKEPSKQKYPIEGLDRPCHRLKPDPELTFFY
ncbi:hypothetical protein ACFQZI_02195 [Mucilaginibacter lutimaris]|uniref:Methyltransferase FkbM domain-containing protein n=1 Tax=Mucilaginibacter lutimaris TaxID=931629 RepID=A0ABW2ZC56_9SPHI